MHLESYVLVAVTNFHESKSFVFIEENSGRVFSFKIEENENGFTSYIPENINLQMVYNEIGSEKKHIKYIPEEYITASMKLLTMSQEEKLKYLKSEEYQKDIERENNNIIRDNIRILDERKKQILKSIDENYKSLEKVTEIKKELQKRLIKE